jgi:hypothetical protein
MLACDSARDARKQITYPDKHDTQLKTFLQINDCTAKVTPDRKNAAGIVRQEKQNYPLGAY